MRRTEFRILIPAIEYEGVGGLGNLVGAHKCRIRGCCSRRGRYHTRLRGSGRSPDGGMRVFHRRGYIINDLEDSENTTIGEVFNWSNDISIPGGIVLDVYILCKENAGAVSSDRCGRHFVTYQNLVAIASTAALPI
jgi:hypothetical protein